MHNMYYDQLMIAAQDDEELSKLLWDECAQTVSGIRRKGTSIQSASDADKADEPAQNEGDPDAVQKLFAAIEPECPVKDQGLLSIKCRTSGVAKKFKYFTNKPGLLQVYSSIPVIVKMKTHMVQAD